jgi:Rrf2 family protein
MKFSTQEEYGLRCLVQIGRHDAQGGRTIPEISQLENLSVANVAKLTRLLRLGGFVESVRGQDGGYKLSRPADRILVGEVLAVLGGRLYTPDFCEKHSGPDQVCSHTAVGCTVRSLWESVQGAVDHALANITIQDLLGTKPKPIAGLQIPVLHAN